MDLSPHLLKTAKINGHMKAEDCELIPLAKEFFAPEVELIAPESALFYPSAGTDLLTPLMIALPYCSQFYFYDHDLDELWLRSDCHKVFSLICRIKGINPAQSCWMENSNSKTLEFNYLGKEKTLFWVNDDNLNFLSKSSLNLVFYFHRGDSYGEGGSRQFWDSELLDELIKLIKPGCKCCFITDGQPGGPSNKLLNAATVVEFDGRDEKYYLGKLMPR